MLGVTLGFNRDAKLLCDCEFSCVADGFSEKDVAWNALVLYRLLCCTIHIADFSPINTSPRNLRSRGVSLGSAVCAVSGCVAGGGAVSVGGGASVVQSAVQFALRQFQLVMQPQVLMRQFLLVQNPVFQ
ncbi:hypothetical protein [Neisseria gonorrhoeae]|uniref:hypothetical protein n=1 Tax=Neisseria gonorrhoeae TaxID=485 RepID=UPI00215DA362|nr:hypothetical protein [Neisseria gonorrhoeae]